jgi:hypothetical protein
MTNLNWAWGGVVAAMIMGLTFIEKAQSEEVILHTSPVSDGYLADKRQVWKDEPSAVEDSGKVAHVGSFFTQMGVGIFEFSLPPADKIPGGRVASAKLILYANAYTRTGAQADETSTANVDVDIYGYTDKNADGVVSMEDWNAGEKLQRWLVKDETLTGRGTPLPPVDVTEFVQKALDAKKGFVGFRLRPENIQKSVNEYIVIRTAEFNEDLANCPKLVIKFN